MRGEIRKCPVCLVAIPRGKLMCRDHWFMVTPATRRKVNATWREFKHAEKGEAQLFALREYRIAHEAAIAEALAADKARVAA
jgi:hypothetical protein